MLQIGETFIVLSRQIKFKTFDRNYNLLLIQSNPIYAVWSRNTVWWLLTNVNLCLLYHTASWRCFNWKSGHISFLISISPSILQYLVSSLKLRLLYISVFNTSSNLSSVRLSWLAYHFVISSIFSNTSKVKHMPRRTMRGN